MLGLLFFFFGLVTRLGKFHKVSEGFEELLTTAGASTLLVASEKFAPENPALVGRVPALYGNPELNSKFEFEFEFGVSGRKESEIWDLVSLPWL